MPFQRPTLSSLIAQAKADVQLELGVPTLLRFSPENAFATALAGLTQGLYGYLDWIAQQGVPFTARDEYLEAWAQLVGVARKPATQASGSVTFTGTNGTSLPLNTAVVRVNDGVRYRTTSAGTVSGGVVTVPVLAELAGADGEAGNGVFVSLGTAIAGINGTGQAVTPLTGGADAETDDALRTRMLAAYADPPQGGAASDYVEWALEVPGVTRAWSRPLAHGAGTVTVYIMLDDVRSAGAGFPIGTNGGATAETRISAATGDQLLVADHIYPLRPATALVYVESPLGQNIPFTIGSVPDVSLRPAITDALAAVFKAKASVGGTMYPSDFTAALDQVPGLSHYAMSSPTAPVTASAGYLPVLGAITWT